MPSSTVEAYPKRSGGSLAPTGPAWAATRILVEPPSEEVA